MIPELYLAFLGTRVRIRKALRSRMHLPLLVGLVVPWVLLIACAPELRGRYTWGHEVNTMQLCDSDQVYWVRCDRPWPPV